MSDHGDWRDELRDAWADRDGPRLIALATLARPGQPAVRMLVVRRFEAGGDLLMCTDTRSHKWDELEASVNVEGLVWIELARMQFRLAGACKFETGDAARQSVWDDMSDSARALFAWPAPAEDRQPDDQFVKGLPADTPMPANFGVLRLMASEVDVLDLKPSPHVRMIWSPDADGWTGHRVNP